MLKLIETPIGAPENDNETGALKLLTEFTEIDTCPEPPCMMLREVGADSVNVGSNCPFAKE